MITQESSIEPSLAQRMQIERKYGMFIHFGINTFNNCEWSDGTLKLESYKPVTIDAEQWVKNAYRAGMNYVILITKHHDGFCLFDTKYTDYSVNNTSNKTDVVAEVAKACKKYGVKLGLYYSLWDRHEKCYSDNEKYVDYMCNQLTELLGGKYGEVVELWLDGSWDKKNNTDWNISRLYDLVKRLQPNCVMSSNITIGEDTATGWNDVKYMPEKYEENMPIRYFPSDFRLWDPNFTKEGKEDPKLYMHDGKQYYMPFEATICIRNMRNWFWDPFYKFDRLVGVKFVAKKYTHLINQNNVLVVNVAPDKNGRQINGDIKRLNKIAKALGIYRELD